MGKPDQKCAQTQSDRKLTTVQRNHERGAAKHLVQRRKENESLEVKNLKLMKEVLSLRHKKKLFKGAVEELLNSNDCHSNACREEVVQFIIKTELSPDHQSPDHDDEQMNQSHDNMHTAMSLYTNTHHAHPSIVQPFVPDVRKDNASSAVTFSLSHSDSSFRTRHKEDKMDMQTVSRKTATDYSFSNTSNPSSWNQLSGHLLNNNRDLIVRNESENLSNASPSNCRSLSALNPNAMTLQASLHIVPDAQLYGSEPSDTFDILDLGEDDPMLQACLNTELSDVKEEPQPYEEMQFISLPAQSSQNFSEFLSQIKNEPSEAVLKTEPTLEDLGITDAQDPTQAKLQEGCVSHLFQKLVSENVSFSDKAQSTVGDFKASDDENWDPVLSSQEWFNPETPSCQEFSRSNSSEHSPNSFISPNSLASPDSPWKNTERTYGRSPEKPSHGFIKTTGGRTPRRIVSYEKLVIENGKDCCCPSSQKTNLGDSVTDEKDMRLTNQISGDHMPENGGTTTKNLKQAAEATTGDDLTKTANETPEPTAEDETFKEPNDNISKCSCIKNTQTRTNNVASDSHTKTTPECMLPEKPATSQSHEPAKTEHPDLANSPDKNNIVDNNAREDGVESSKHSDPHSIKIPPDGEETVVTKEDTEKSLESSENKLISVLVPPEAAVPETRHTLPPDVAETVHADNLPAHTILSKTSQAPSPASCVEDDTTKTLPSVDFPRPASPKPFRANPGHSCSTDSNNKSLGTSAGGTDEEPPVDKSNPSPEKDAVTQTVSTSLIDSEADEKPCGTHSVLLSQAAETNESPKLDAADSLKDHATEVTPFPSLSSNDRDEQTSDVNDEQTSTEVLGPGMNILRDSCKQVVQESFAKLTIEDGESSDPARSLSEKLKGMAL